MTLLNVPDMSCAHCKAAVEKAIASVDPTAAVAVDLDRHSVEVASQAPAEALIAALGTVGYPATVG